MNVLFLTMGSFDSIEAHSIYADLLRCFRDYGHEVYVISPNEKKTGLKTELITGKGSHVLHLRTGNVTGVSNVISKGIAQVSIESTYIQGIKKYFSNVRFDLVLYSTPPITLEKAVAYVKKRDKAKTYLLLKDIFPQNAVDLGMMSKDGIKGLIYKYFRAKEKKLYAISDRIGCMSEANVRYLLEHNPEIDPKKVEICPNCIEVIDKSIDEETRKQIREKFGIPLDKKVFVYGGNLGKPQGITFFIECMKKCRDIKEAFFLVVGNGTEYRLLEEYVTDSRQENLKLMKSLPKDDYDKLVATCDVGMIFLDHRFAIPNFPSRILGYMQAKLPILACTDPNTDVGKVIVDGGFGWWCVSNDSEIFAERIRTALTYDGGKNLGFMSFEYLKENFSVQRGYKIISKML